MLWEPGSWKPPGTTTLVNPSNLNNPAVTPTPVKPTGEALAMAMEPKKDGTQLTLGRGMECDAVINDGTLSTLHLVFMQGPGVVWTVRDAGSRNGSTLDGVKLEAGKPKELRTGCKLTAAGVTFTYYGPAGMLQRLKA